MWVNLGAILDKYDMTAGELGRAMKKPRSEVTRWFRPSYDPRITQIIAWARAIGCEPIELLDPSMPDDTLQIPRPTSAVRAIEETAARVAEIQAAKEAKKKASQKKKALKVTKLKR